MSIEKFLQAIKREAKHFFPEGQFIILEEFPFYFKIRLLLKNKCFVEIRVNTRSKRESYALIKNRTRIAGFDNLDGWHLHPFENPTAHRHIDRPSLKEVFFYFKK